jgi:bifunctional N-acetylglucosamine-1-phosphate-uridyltransferase/glucosamine-1-phosphate-acetyltransferase GlmU-like protein
VPDFKDWRQTFLRYGRIIRKNNHIIDREYKDATEEEREVKELNVSCYVFDAEWLWNNFKKIENNTNIQKEYYLTDLWQIASENGDKIDSITIDPKEALGANTKEELEMLEKLAPKNYI